ncbi:MAG: hypothetical protein FWJ70_16410 [Micromonosporaceae bacterium]|jgi:hypothetical protein
MTDVDDLVRHAYADLHLAVPESTLSRLVRRRRRRLATLGAAAAVVAVAAGAGVALELGEPAPPVATSPTGDPARLDMDRYVVPVDLPWLAECLEGLGLVDARPGAEPSELGDLNVRGTLRPETAFQFADDRIRFGLVLAEQAAAACWEPLDNGSGRPGTVSDGGYAGLFTSDGWRWLPEGPLPSFRHFVHTGGGEDYSLVAGKAPTGTERVEIVLDDGTVVSAVVDGEWFAAWLPGSSGHTFVDTIVEVAAYTPDAVRVRGVDEVEPTAEALDEAEWMALYEKELAERAGELRLRGVDVPTDAEFVRFIEPDEYGRVHSACLRDQGFEAEETFDGGVQFGDVPSELASAQQQAMYRCEVMYPVHPRYSLPLTDGQIRVIYDYFVGPLVDCLTAEGYDVPAAPPWETFLADHNSPKGAWHPYDAVDPTTEAQWQQINEKCPQSPPLADLYRSDG